uniref:Uncharacterized protein n=1 Tax=Kalanchoe fedtschenkoi TaxID=63787 RepID=A0A7N0U525_KALFE
MEASRPLLIYFLYLDVVFLISHSTFINPPFSQTNLSFSITTNRSLHVHRQAPEALPNHPATARAPPIALAASRLHLSVVACTTNWLFCHTFSWILFHFLNQTMSHGSKIQRLDSWLEDLLNITYYINFLPQPASLH